MIERIREDPRDPCSSS